MKNQDQETRQHAPANNNHQLSRGEGEEGVRAFRPFYYARMVQLPTGEFLAYLPGGAFNICEGTPQNTQAETIISLVNAAQTRWPDITPVFNFSPLEIL